MNKTIVFKCEAVSFENFQIPFMKMSAHFKPLDLNWLSCMAEDLKSPTCCKN